jgi:UDP-N-acetylglucosamine enolpyruvyl transferase
MLLDEASVTGTAKYYGSFLAKVQLQFTTHWNHICNSFHKMLNSMGSKYYWVGSNLTIIGVRSLSGCEHRILPHDRNRKLDWFGCYDEKYNQRCKLG